MLLPVRHSEQPVGRVALGKMPGQLASQLAAGLSGNLLRLIEVQALHRFCHPAVQQAMPQLAHFSISYFHYQGMINTEPVPIDV